MKKVEKSKLAYYDGKHEIPQGSFRISASGISRYFTSTSKWFRENLHGEPGFEGSTASVLGTIVHYGLECYGKGILFEENEIDLYLSTLTIEVDEHYIRSQYHAMIAMGISYMTEYHPSVTSERFLTYEVVPGIYVGGSCDAYDTQVTTQGKCVIDYKTTSAKKLPEKIAYAHKLQLLTYARLLRQQGTDITHVSIVYITTYIDGGLSEKTGRPLKSYPNQVVELCEEITTEDMEMIVNIHQTIADAVEAYRDFPHLRGIISQDNRLKSLPTTLTKPEEEEV